MSGLLANKGRSVAILSDNGTEFKNKILNEICNQLGIEMLFSSLFHPQGNAKMENVHNCLKKPSPNSWIIVISKGMNSFNSFVIAITYFQVAMALNLHSSLCLDEIQQKDAYLTLTTAIGIIEPMNRNIVLEELHKLGKHYTKHFKELYQRNE